MRRAWAWLVVAWDSWLALNSRQEPPEEQQEHVDARSAKLVHQAEKQHEARK